MPINARMTPMAMVFVSSFVETCVSAVKGFTERRLRLAGSRSDQSLERLWGTMPISSALLGSEASSSVKLGLVIFHVLGQAGNARLNLVRLEGMLHHLGTQR
ncbi:MAG: hypothetical protein ACLS6O_01005 [Bifidobacterium sp.]